jgi:hypothetical protein
VKSTCSFSRTQVSLWCPSRTTIIKSLGVILEIEEALSGLDVLHKIDGTAPRIEHFISHLSRDEEFAMAATVVSYPTAYTRSELYGTSRSRGHSMRIIELHSGSS